MASGNTLLIFTPLAAEPPASFAATPDVRNQHPVLDFDDTTQETALFTGVLPRHYAGGGLTVRVHWAATSATSGTVGWDVAVERIGDGQQDLDADGFASAKTIAATDVPATSGLVKITSADLASGDEMDNLAAGEAFRLRLRRDVAADSAAGDAELLALEIEES